MVPNGGNALIEYYKTGNGYAALTERVIEGEFGPFRVGHGPHWGNKPPLETIQTFHYGLYQIEQWEKVDPDSVPDEWFRALGYETREPAVEYFLAKEGYIAVTDKRIPEPRGHFRLGRGPEIGVKMGEHSVDSITDRAFGKDTLSMYDRVRRENVPQEWVDALGYEEVARVGGRFYQSAIGALGELALVALSIIVILLFFI